MNNPIAFSEHEYLIFKILYFVQYIASEKDIPICIEEVFGPLAVSEGAILKQLYSDGLVDKIGVLIKTSPSEPMADNGTFYSYEALDLACFYHGYEDHMPAELCGDLCYALSVRKEAADCFLKSYLQKWHANLFARPTKPFLAFKAQIKGIVESIYYELGKFPHNNLFLSEDSLYFSTVRTQSLPFCVFAYLQFNGFVKVIGLTQERLTTSVYQVFHLIISPSFFDTLGLTDHEFRRRLPNLFFENEWGVAANKIQILFRNNSLIFQGNTKGLNRNGLPLALVKFSQQQPNQQVIIADFIQANKDVLGIKNEEDFQKKLTAFRHDCKKAFDLDASYLLFPTKRGVLDLSAIKFGV